MRKANGSTSDAPSDAPWDDQIAHLMSREGMPRDKARDRVILDHLKRGDSNVLAALLIDGHVPAPNLRFVLALMLLDNEAADAALARHYGDPDPWWLPYRLVVKPRPAKPRRAHGGERVAGHRPAERSSGPMMPDLAYEAAIARLDQAVLAADGGAKAAAGGKGAAGGKVAARGKTKPAARQPPRPKRKR
jgi:hypothetical protein